MAWQMGTPDMDLKALNMLSAASLKSTAKPPLNSMRPNRAKPANRLLKKSLACRCATGVASNRPGRSDLCDRPILPGWRSRS
jgi:hypothetical protein